MAFMKLETVRPAKPPPRFFVELLPGDVFQVEHVVEDSVNQDSLEMRTAVKVASPTGVRANAMDLESFALYCYTDEQRVCSVKEVELKVTLY